MEDPWTVYVVLGRIPHDSFLLALNMPSKRVVDACVPYKFAGSFVSLKGHGDGEYTAASTQ